MCVSIELLSTSSTQCDADPVKQWYKTKVGGAVNIYNIEQLELVSCFSIAYIDSIRDFKFTFRRIGITQNNGVLHSQLQKVGGTRS